MSGRDNGHVPFRMNGFWGRFIMARLILRVLFHRIMTIKTPMGRKMRAKVMHQGGPLIRVWSKDLDALGVERTPKTKGVENGRPVLEDGRALDVANIIWTTGFSSGFSWIDLPIFDDKGEPRHQGGEVSEVPGLFFVGQHFLYSFSSVMLQVFSHCIQ